MKVQVYPSFEVWLASHLAFGALVVWWPLTAAVVTLLVWLGAVVHTLRKADHGAFAGYAAVYLAGMELLLRMSSSGLPHEFAKYAISSLLLAAVLINRRPRSLPWPIAIYFLALLISGVWMASHVFEWSEGIDQLSFNLSGPLCLCAGAFYFYNKIYDRDGLSRLIQSGLLPIAATVGFLYSKSPAVGQIKFTFSANFAASGGYGPNQVATILGLGLLLIGFAWIWKLPISKNKLVLIVLGCLLTIRGLLTFSRGGMLSPVVIGLAMAVVYLFKSGASRKKIAQWLASVVGLFLLVWMIFQSLNTATGHKLYYRFSGERPNGSHIGLAKYSSGRLTIIKTDLALFWQKPLTGIGPGMGKYSRTEFGANRLIAAHIEPSRMLAEHGLAGLLALLILLIFPFYVIRQRLTAEEQLWWLLGIGSCLLFMTHSATRLAFPMLLYGMGLIQIVSYGNDRSRQAVSQQD